MKLGEISGLGMRLGCMMSVDSHSVAVSIANLAGYCGNCLPGYWCPCRAVAVLGNFLWRRWERPFRSGR